MGMTKLRGVTGHETNADLRAEFDRLLEYLVQVKGLMSPYHLRFVTDMEAQQLASGTWVPTAGQLFALRDMKDLY
jgi:hypothetical protein